MDTDSRQAGTKTTDEIEITPQMTEAGVEASFGLVSSACLEVTIDALVGRIYMAMEAARLESVCNRGD